MNLNMHQAAVEIGLSYDRFRKTWRELARQLGFPRPFLGRTWDADAITAWKAARAGRGLAPPPRREAATSAPKAADGRQARAQLEALRAE